MRPLLLFLILQLIFLQAFAQLPELQNDTIKYCNESNDGIGKYPSMEGKYISTYTFNRLLRRDFSLMTTNEEGLPSIGNYAVVKLSDNDSKIDLNASLFNPLIRNGSNKPIKTIFSLGLKGGFSEGVSSLLSNTSFNNNIGINSRF